MRLTLNEHQANLKIILTGGRQESKRVGLWCFQYYIQLHNPKLIIVTQIIAVKLLSVSPSEMCDECTASKMLLFSTTKCNGLSGVNIIHIP